MRGETIELGKEWDNLCRSDHVSVEDSQECIARLQPLVEELIVCLTSKSNFLGTDPVVIILKNVYFYRDVYAKFDEYSFDHGQLCTRVG